MLTAFYLRVKALQAQEADHALSGIAVQLSGPPDATARYRFSAEG